MMMVPISQHDKIWESRSKEMMKSVKEKLDKFREEKFKAQMDHKREERRLNKLKQKKKISKMEYY